MHSGKPGNQLYIQAFRDNPAKFPEMQFETTSLGAACFCMP
jgi:hypothetical protein